MKFSGERAVRVVTAAYRRQGFAYSSASGNAGSPYSGSFAASLTQNKGGAGGFLSSVTRGLHAKNFPRTGIYNASQRS